MSITCLIASTANLVGTYDNGSGFPGQRATFTFTATGAQFIDDHQLVFSIVDYYLIKDQSNPTQNGIYYVSVAGDVGIQCVLKRVPGYDFPQGLNGADIAAVIAGTSNYQTTWGLKALVSVIGTSNILYVNIGSGSGIQPPTSVTTATYTALYTDRVLICNRAGTIAVTLPGPIGTGFTITIKDASGAASTNNITIAAGGGVLVDGAASLVIAVNYGSVTLIFNGTQWNVI